MTDFIAGEKGVPIRMPSVANLMIDSNDRNSAVYSSPWDFQISKNYSIMNGFFTRIATTEVVLEWCLPNIKYDYNDYIVVDICGTNLLQNQKIQVPTLSQASGSFYTIEQVLDALVEEMNNLTATTGVTFQVSVLPSGLVTIEATGGEFEVVEESILQQNLHLTLNVMSDFNQVWGCPDLRLIKYIDFVSTQLTYCQDVKDNSTATYNKDVLCRWYMAWDTEPQYDGYGFPILMGYKQFQVRRLFNPPKQIKWDANQPLGNLAFQCYDQDGDLLILSDGNAEYDSSWYMTLQLSEV